MNAIDTRAIPVGFATKLIPLLAAGLLALSCREVRAAATGAGLLDDRPPFGLGGEATPGREESYCFYAIEDIARAQVVQRGYSTLSGIASVNIILRAETTYPIWLFHGSGLQGYMDIPSPSVRQAVFFPRRTSRRGGYVDSAKDVGSHEGTKL